MPFVPTEELTPFDRIGGEASVRALSERFYDVMDTQEPELAALHPLQNGKVSRVSRDRFALFLIGWLGGPQEYMRLHGHPRLRMRHGRVLVNLQMRDAWLRCVNSALAHPSVDLELREYLSQRFAEVADFLRNQPE